LRHGFERCLKRAESCDEFAPRSGQPGAATVASSGRGFKHRRIERPIQALELEPRLPVAHLHGPCGSADRPMTFHQAEKLDLPRPNRLTVGQIDAKSDQVHERIAPEWRTG